MSAEFGDARLPDRFWEKVDSHGPIPVKRPELGECWVWTAAKHRQGYGFFRWGAGSMKLAHVVAFDVLVGPPSEGFERDHLCENPPCVRPSHLEAVTHQVNTARGGASVKTGMNPVCRNGHIRTPENTRAYRDGTRCLDCRAIERGKAA